MKINDKNIFIYLLLTFVIAGCASEDPDPDAVNDDEIDFATGLFDPENLIDGDFMVVPEALEDVNNPCAQLVRTYVIYTNTILTYSAYFIPGFSYTESNDPIELVSGHNNYRVYEWSDNLGTAIAIQFSEDSNWRYYKVFFKEESSDYLKYIESREYLKGSGNGIVEIFDLSDTEEVEIRYTWALNENGSREVKLEQPEYSDELVFIRVQEDFSGELEYTEYDGTLTVVHWNAIGEGDWVEYDPNGAEVDSGSWNI